MKLTERSSIEGKPASRAIVTHSRSAAYAQRWVRHQLAMEVSEFETVRRLLSVNQRGSQNGAESS